jgi:hypothetical protein
MSFDTDWRSFGASLCFNALGSDKGGGEKFYNVLGLTCSPPNDGPTSELFFSAIAKKVAYNKRYNTAYFRMHFQSKKEKWCLTDAGDDQYVQLKPCDNSISQMWFLHAKRFP